ncbi:MAG TPA: dihydroxy-acid dehydratase, partial [Hyphomicrobiaceae bacterium]|nr:dihydroxy-acid dehydratase [Hyphomicrobiaceae bacterium]
SPEAAAGGGLALLETGDRVRIDLGKGTADILISDAELAERRKRLEARGGYPYPEHQTPWQELYRSTVGQQSTGACLELATRYRDIVQRFGAPRHSH